MLPKNAIIEILRIWNYWDKSPDNVNSREAYEKKIQDFRKAREVIVLKGIRRSGKSSLLSLEIRNLLIKTKQNNILFVNFEEPKFNDYLNLDLLDAIYESYLEYLEPQGRKYIFLDEVQNIDAWEKWVLRMYEKEDVQIYVTGSSSKLLSREFSTVLSGRHLSIEVFPLDFKEFLSFSQINIGSKFDMISKKRALVKLFKEYVTWGGFPKIVGLDAELLKKNDLTSYFETIILKDIAKRYQISNTEDLKSLVLFLISNIAKPYSINSLKNSNLGAYDTIKKYIEFIKDTYLIFDLMIYSKSLKTQLVNPKKTYCIDTGLANSVSFRFSEDYGRLLENVVFIELIRNGNEVYYHKGNHECDFLIKKGLKIDAAIQVTRSLFNEETRKREIDGLYEALDTYKLREGLILTEDEENEFTIRGKTVRVIPIWKWLLSIDIDKI